MENSRASESHSKDSDGHRQGSPHGHQGGRTRRAQRSSLSESHASEGGFGPVYGAGGEIVWFNSNMYGHADGSLQSVAILGTSPKEPSAHRSLVFRAKRKLTQHNQEEGNHNRGQFFSSQKSQRSSSEPQKEGRRKRGHSETERTPSRKRDKYGFRLGMKCFACYFERKGLPCLV